MMMTALGLVMVLAGVGGWRLRVVSQDIGLLDRELAKLHGPMTKARRGRAETVCPTKAAASENGDSNIPSARGGGHPATTSPCDRNLGDEVGLTW